MTLVPGSVNTVPLNADPSEWVTVPFASLQNIPSGQQFTAVLLIDDVPNTVFPFDEDTSNDNSNSYFDIDNPVGNVNTYDLATPNNPTPNGVTYPGQPAGATNAFVGTTIMRVNQTTATLTVTGGGDFSGNLQESGDQQNGGNFLALTVGGTGTSLVLSGDNTYSGLTTIDSGDTLQAGSTTALTASTSVLDNGTLDLNGNDLSINALNGSASGVVTDSATSATLTVTGGGSFAGNVTGTNTGLTLLPSTLTLSGDNTYGGPTTINTGDILQAGSITAFSPNSNVLDNGTLDLAGFSNSINALSGNGVVIDSAAAATLSVNGGGSFSGVLQDVSGPLALTVGGTSETLTLSGASTYSGPTTVTNTDTLVVDGSETSPVTVAGTLGGTGTVGDLAVAGGTVDPGDPVTSTGTLSANSADFSSAGNLSVEINGGTPTNDLLSVAGSVTMGGSSSLTIDLNGLSSTGTFTIVSDSSQSGTFTTVNVVNNPHGYSVTVGYTGNTVIVTVGPGAAGPSITDVVLNQDITALNSAVTGTAQRSMVEDIVYTFSAPVNIVSNTVDPNLFHITALTVNGVTGVVPSTIEWAPVAGSGGLQWEVDFGVNASATNSQVGALNSIANGCYTITITNFSEITAVSGGAAASINAGSAPGVASSTLPGYVPANANYATQSFYRLFGDGNGDMVVNPGDNNKFKAAITTYNPAFDFNQDGVVNPGDNNRFKADLTVNFLGFTETI